MFFCGGMAHRLYQELWHSPSLAGWTMWCCQQWMPTHPQEMWIPTITWIHPRFRSAVTCIEGRGKEKNPFNWTLSWTLNGCTGTWYVAGTSSCTLMHQKTFVAHLHRWPYQVQVTQRASYRNGVLRCHDWMPEWFAVCLFSLKSAKNNEENNGSHWITLEKFLKNNYCIHKVCKNP